MRWRFCISRWRPFGFGGSSEGIWSDTEAGLAGLMSGEATSGEETPSEDVVAIVEGQHWKEEMFRIQKTGGFFPEESDKTQDGRSGDTARGTMGGDQTVIVEDRNTVVC